MAYTNLPLNLQDMFYTINDRVAKLETGPSSAQTTADGALSTANTALANAAIAYALAGTSLQKDANTITNSSNNMTAINATGITIYSGASATTGARVIMNSAGLAGYNSSGTATFSILASTGAASFKGAITGSTITGSTLNISGNFIVDSSGHVTATGADITGTINATAGTIGGLTITPYIMYSGNLTIDGTSGRISSTEYAFFKKISIDGAILGDSFAFAVTGNAYTTGVFQALGNMTASAYLYNSGYASTTGSANVRINTTPGLSLGLIAFTSSSERYKVEIEEQTIPISSILALTPKSYIDKVEFEEKGTTEGLQRWLGLVAEDIDQIPVLDKLLVERDAEGKPNSVYYDRVATALIPLLKDLNNRVTQLEGK